METSMKTKLKKTSILMLENRVLVKQSEPEKKTASGIIIPDTAKEKPLRGIVIAVGPGKKEENILQDMTVVPGDIVLYSKYGGNDVSIDGEDYLIMKESDIYSILYENE